MTKTERDALRLVNKIRRYEGRKALKRLPKGDPYEVYTCPIARALDHGRVAVSSVIELEQKYAKKITAFKKAGLVVHYQDAAHETDAMISFTLPKRFETFIEWFDAQDDPAAEKLARAR